jgi:hypothetical protein
VCSARAQVNPNQTYCIHYTCVIALALHSILSKRRAQSSAAMAARNKVGIGLSNRPASLRSLATQFQNRFLESIPRPIAGLKFSTQVPFLSNMYALCWNFRIIYGGSDPVGIGFAPARQATKAGRFDSLEKILSLPPS